MVGGFVELDLGFEGVEVLEGGGVGQLERLELRCEGVVLGEKIPYLTIFVKD